MLEQLQNRNTIKSRWTKLDTQRSSVLDRVRKCAKLTIPALMPPEGSDENTTLETPYQGLGARGTNNLASKLLIALLPPNAPFFRLTIDDFTLEQMTGQEGMRAEVEKALNKIERAVMTHVETSALRVPTFEALKLLIVTGNALLYLPDEGGMKVYRLDQYAVKRDPMGNILEIIIKESVHPVALPKSIREKVIANLKNPNETVDLYTRVVRNEEDQWEVSQECADEIIQDSIGTYPLDNCPWLPLRWSSLVSEDYGRGLVEEYLGDLLTLEALTKAVTEGSVIAAKILFLVDPNGTTRPKKIASAANGAVIEGNADDVSVLQLEKYADFQVAAETAKRIETRLSYAFLLMQSVQRDAERVTAEEIRQMAKELEDSLGGVYSVLSQEMQLPLVRRLMKQLTKTNKLPALPDKIVQPSIVTGLEALGRGNDLNKLNIFISQISPFGEAAFTRLNMGDFMTRVGTALGLDMDGLVKSEEEVMQEQQEMMMAQMAQNALPNMAQEVTKGMVNQPQQTPNPN